MNRLRFGALTAGFAAASSGLAAAQAAAVTVGSIPIDNGAEVFYAQDQGLFKRAAPYAEKLDPAQVAPVIAFAAKYQIIPAVFPPREAIDSAVL